MDAHATINGIQEVSGSIPLISTKTKSHSERNGFCFILRQKGAKNAMVRRFVFLRRAGAAFLRLRTENRKNELRGGGTAAGVSRLSPPSKRHPSGCLSVSKKPRRVSRPQARKTCRLFFPAACTSGKIYSGLQVCRLSAFGGQIVRAAGRGLLSKNSQGVFRQPQTSFRMSFFATVPPRPTAAAAAAASRRRFSS